MQLEIISYNNLKNLTETAKLEKALLMHGIVGISDVPNFEKKSRAYVEAAIAFSSLPEKIKEQYAPDRDSGDTDGYELGAEKFKTADGVWQIDRKKESFYANVPDCIQNKWPREVDLKTSYLALGDLIFQTGKKVLNAIGLNEKIGLKEEFLRGYGRMLHYHKDTN